MKRYETYKDSGAEWIGEIPESWKGVNLKWISNITKGKKPKVDFDENGENLLPYLSMEFLRGKTSNPTYASIEEKGLVHIDDGDILILWDGSKAGEIVKAKKGILSSTMAKIEINDNNFESNYLNYLLQLGERHVQEHTIGMGIPHVSGDILKMLPMLVPSPQEQTQIAAYLDYKTGLIDSIIAQKEDLIKKLKEQRQAIINEAVTKGLNPNVKLKDSGIEWLGEIPEHWSVVKLFHLCDNIGSGTTPKSNKREYYDGEIGWLNTGDLNDSFVEKASKTITKKALEDYSVLKLYPENSIVIALYGATIGKLAIIGSEMATNQACCVLNSNQKLNSKYLFFLLLASRTYLLSLSYGGGQPNISQEIIKQLRVTLPDINEQEEIVKRIEEKLNRIDKAFEKTNNSTQKLKEYRQSLISEAVTGKIDVRDWQAPKS